MYFSKKVTMRFIHYLLHFGRFLPPVLCTQASTKSMRNSINPELLLVLAKLMSIDVKKWPMAQKASKMGSPKTWQRASKPFQDTVRRSRDPSEEASDHRKRHKNEQNHQNHRKLTNMALPGLRIRPFESQSHFLSIANPPRPQIPPENSQNRPFPKNRKIRESAGVGGNGRSPFRE